MPEQVIDLRPQGSDYYGIIDAPPMLITTPWGQITLVMVPCLCCGRPTCGRFTSVLGFTYAACGCAASRLLMPLVRVG